MATAFRIFDRFKITGRGNVYMLKPNNAAVLRVGDILYDLHGNRFRIKCIEMPTKPCFGSKGLDDLPIGIVLENENGISVQGNLLVTNPDDINFLFCNHPLYPNRVDEGYQKEYQAAGLHHACALFSYENLLDGQLCLYGEQISGLTIYRGWMLKPELYRKLYILLEEQGIMLINEPEEYEKYHLFPNWYEDFEDITAPSVWTNGTNLEDVMQIGKLLEGPYVVKDYVKSRKHEWYDACFIRDMKNEANLEEIVNNFVKRQGTDLVGGIVLRKFEELNRIGFHSQSGMPLAEEYRIFVYGGRVIALEDYWNKSTNTRLSVDEYKWIEEIAKRVKSNFVSIDVDRKVNGTLMIMELGDGQVSGLQEIGETEFYRAFHGQDVLNPYSMEEFKSAIMTYIRLDIYPEISLFFRDKEDEYFIVGYVGHVDFQKCGSDDQVLEFPDLESLFSAELIDGICLNRDWYKLEAIDCRPEIDDKDFVIETYRVAFEQRERKLGERYQIFQIIKKEIDKWNPYGLLPDAPYDEFNSQCELITDKIRFNSTIESIAKRISRVFSEAFEPESFTVDSCMEVAGKIKMELEKREVDLFK